MIWSTLTSIFFLLKLKRLQLESSALGSTL